MRGRNESYEVAGLFDASRYQASETFVASLATDFDTNSKRNGLARRGRKEWPICPGDSEREQEVFGFKV